MRFDYKTILFFFFLSGFLSCKIENLEDLANIPKDDFSDHAYVLATEDASDVDITTFFSFNLEDVDPHASYDLLNEDPLFINANPSTSSGFLSLHQYIFSFAKDKKGYSSSPGLYRLTQDKADRIFVENQLHISKDNLFPARQICIVNDHLGYFYDEGKEAQSIQIFDPLNMVLKGSIDLKPAIEAFRPDAQWTDISGNNLIRTGTLVLEESGGKLYVSIVFLEKAGFNLIADSETRFYVAVVNIHTNEVEKIISYEGAKTVAFYVSENKGTSVDAEGNIYFCSWGWNQFNAHFPSRVFRIKAGETDFDPDWKIDIEQLFGKERIAQSIAAFNGKIYLHISDDPYTFSEDEDVKGVHLSYYEFDPNHPEEAHKLDIPSSNTSSRMNVFSRIGEKLFIAVPNREEGTFNGFYSIDTEGHVQKEITIANKYRPTRLYRLQE